MYTRGRIYTVVGVCAQQSHMKHRRLTTACNTRYLAGRLHCAQTIRRVVALQRGASSQPCHDLLRTCAVMEPALTAAGVATPAARRPIAAQKDVFIVVVVVREVVVASALDHSFGGGSPSQK